MATDTPNTPDTPDTPDMPSIPETARPGGGRREGERREAAVETIQREMTAFARRARSAAAQMHPELSLVSFTLLSHLEERPGRRAADLAAHYALDKSTVSRQVAALERAGLVARRADPDDHRVQVLELTPAGTAALAQAAGSRRVMFHERLADWHREDLERFAAYLLRYNNHPGDGEHGEHRDGGDGGDSGDGEGDGHPQDGEGEGGGGGGCGGPRRARTRAH